MRLTATTRLCTILFHHPRFAFVKLAMDGHEGDFAIEDFDFILNNHYAITPSKFRIVMDWVDQEEGVLLGGEVDAGPAGDVVCI